MNFYKVILPTFLVKYFLDKCNKNFIACRFFQGKFFKSSSKIVLLIR